MADPDPHHRPGAANDDATGGTRPAPASDDGPGARCESCGWPGDDTEPVRRVFLVLDPMGAVVDQREDDTVERWCVSCRLTYPHRPA